MITELSVKARAKINLTLDIGGLRNDGYHEISTVMTTLALADTLSFRPASGNDVQMYSNHPDLTASEDNIAYRVLMWMRKTYDIREGVAVTLEKRIPMAAGLAGGSADCAAVIRGVNMYHGLGLSCETMMNIGARFGSDVPFCVLGRTALAQGRGERITVLDTSMPPCHVVLVKPVFGISTKWSYRAFDPTKVVIRPDHEGLIRAMHTCDYDQIGRFMMNLFEIHTFQKFPVLEMIRDDLITSGAFGALMSGSGPTVYGLYKDSRTAEEAAGLLKKTYPEGYQIFYTTTEEQDA